MSYDELTFPMKRWIELIYVIDFIDISNPFEFQIPIIDHNLVDDHAARNNNLHQQIVAYSFCHRHYICRMFEQFNDVCSFICKTIEVIIIFHYFDSMMIHNFFKQKYIFVSCNTVEFQNKRYCSSSFRMITWTLLISGWVKHLINLKWGLTKNMFCHTFSVENVNKNSLYCLFSVDNQVFEATTIGTIN